MTSAVSLWGHALLFNRAVWCFFDDVYHVAGRLGTSQEWATVDQVLQIENLIQETSSDREKVMAWICGAANCQIEAFNQLLKKDAQSVISMLKKKAAKND